MLAKQKTNSRDFGWPGTDSYVLFWQAFVANKDVPVQRHIIIKTPYDHSSTTTFRPFVEKERASSLFRGLIGDGLSGHVKAPGTASERSKNLLPPSLRLRRDGGIIAPRPGPSSDSVVIYFGSLLMGILPQQ